MTAAAATITTASTATTTTLSLTYEGGEVAQSVERATFGEEVLGSIPVVAARLLLVRSVSI